MPFGTNYLRMKADEYRALAAAMTDGAIRLQLLNMAQRYDQEAEHNERQHPAVGRQSRHIALGTSPTALLARDGNAPILQTA